jgi:anti-anti-sigma regulatory factor
VIDARSDAWEGEGAPATTRIGSVLVVTLPREVDDASLGALRTVVLGRLHREPTKVLVFEASGLDVIDAVEFGALSLVARSAAWLGVRSALVGLSAGIVGYVVGADLDTAAFETYGTLEDALAAVGEAPAAHDAARTHGGGA